MADERTQALREGARGTKNAKRSLYVFVLGGLLAAGGPLLQWSWQAWPPAWSAWVGDMRPLLQGGLVLCLLVSGWWLGVQISALSVRSSRFETVIMSRDLRRPGHVEGVDTRR